MYLICLNSAFEEKIWNKNVFWENLCENCQNVFRKRSCHDNGLIGMDLLNTSLSSSIDFIESHQISLQ